MRPPPTAAAARDRTVSAHARLGLARLLKARSLARHPGLVLAAVLIVGAALRAVWLWLPDHQMIFDETYYVNAARAILGWHVPAGAPYATAAAGIDPNAEHPPLGKLAIAASMLVFGDNGIGWRVPSLVAGLVALAALYGIVRAAGGGRWLGVGATSLFAFDNLAFVHGRIGTLDMLYLAPLLLAAWLALRRNWVSAGLVAGLATLVKLTAVLGVLAIVAFAALEVARDRRDAVLARTGGEDADALDWRAPIRLVAAFVLTFAAGLWLLDLRFGAYPTPVDHLAHMLSYGLGLQTTPTSGGIVSAPWQWLIDQVQIPYLKIDLNELVGGKIVASHTTIDFEGALNPVLLGAIPLAAPFALWLAWRRSNRLAVWALIWLAATYLPYYPLVLAEHRVTYLYYFLPAVPALAIMAGLLLRRSKLPSLAVLGFLGAYAIGFIAFFPFRQLP